MDPYLGGQKWPTKKEKSKEIYVLKCWMSSFDGWRLFCSLNVLQGGLGKNSWQFWIKARIFFAVKFYIFWSSEPWARIWNWIRIRIDLKCWIRIWIRVETSAPPQELFDIVLGFRIRRIRLFLGLQDPDPSVWGTDPGLGPAPDLSLFWNNACKIGHKHKILAENLIFKTEDNVPVCKL